MAESAPKLRASEAQKLAVLSQEEHLNNAFINIKGASEQGYQEVLLFGIWLSLEGIKELMNYGYSVSIIDHPMEQRKMIKVSW